MVKTYLYWQMSASHFLISNIHIPEGEAPGYPGDWM